MPERKKQRKVNAITETGDAAVIDTKLTKTTSQVILALLAGAGIGAIVTDYLNIDLLKKVKAGASLTKDEEITLRDQLAKALEASAEDKSTIASLKEQISSFVAEDGVSQADVDKIQDLLNSANAELAAARETLRGCESEKALKEARIAELESAANSSSDASAQSQVLLQAAQARIAVLERDLGVCADGKQVKDSEIAGLEATINNLNESLSTLAESWNNFATQSSSGSVPQVSPHGTNESIVEGLKSSMAQFSTSVSSVNADLNERIRSLESELAEAKQASKDATSANSANAMSFINRAISGWNNLSGRTAGDRHQPVSTGYTDPEAAVTSLLGAFSKYSPVVENIDPRRRDVMDAFGTLFTAMRTRGIIDASQEENLKLAIPLTEDTDVAIVTRVAKAVEKGSNTGGSSVALINETIDAWNANTRISTNNRVLLRGNAGLMGLKMAITNATVS